MKGGKIMQLGTPDEIYNRPQNLYVADFIGAPAMNFVRGRLENDLLIFGGRALSVGTYPFTSRPNKSDIVLGIRPENLALGPAAQRCDLQIELTVDLVEKMGADTLVWSELDGKPFRVRVNGQAKIQAGDRVVVGVKASNCSIFDADSEARL